MVPMVMLGAEGGADAASLVTTVTDMAGIMARKRLCIPRSKL